MFVTELVLFIFSALVGMVMYWRESKNNYLYKIMNKIANEENLQMKASERKGFIYKQPFLIRFVVITALFTLLALLLKFLTPIPFRFEMLASNIVGAIVGTYLATFIVSANEKLDNSQNAIEDTFEKGKDFIEDITDDVKGKAKSIKEKIEDKLDSKESDVELTNKQQEERQPKKSGRDRLKDKGLL